MLFGALSAQIYVPPHPIIKHTLALCRAAETPPPMFRKAIAVLGRILTYEALREFLPTLPEQDV